MAEYRSFCRLCASRCGLRLIVEDGRLLRVDADRDDPLGRGFICIKGRAWPEIVNSDDRLLYPQRREGGRGEGRWTRISWDEALTTITDRLSIIKRDYGPESLLLALGDPKGLEIAFAQRFASVFGTPNVSTPGHICHMPRELAASYTFGASCLPDDEQAPRCLVVWGNNFPDTHDGGYTPGKLKEVLDSGTKLVVIDPRRTDLAARAQIWLRPRPGTDGALALGMLRVIIEEGLYDKRFVGEWTTGFDHLAAHLKAYLLDEVAKITWVPRGQIEAAARLYAQNGPASIIWGNALEQSINSFQSLRAVAILKAVTGNLDVPGGEVLAGRLPVTRPGQFMLLREMGRNMEKASGSEFKLAVKSAFIARQVGIKAVQEESLKAALLFGTNPLVTYYNAKEVRRALLKLDLLVVADLFMTPTAALADIVLPVAANFEFDEVAPYPAPLGFTLAYPKLLEPRGECLSDAHIFNELTRKIMPEYAWKDVPEALDAILKPAGLTYARFKEKRVLRADKGYRKYTKGGFGTPSGKVELYSQQLEELGYSPLPVYVSEGTGQHDSEYPLVLTNAKSACYSHSAHRNIASLRRRSPGPVVRLNPETATQFGLTEGDAVFIETARGRIKQKLALDSGLDTRVVLADYGWWFPEREGMEGWDEANLNVLTDPGPPCEPAIGSVVLRGLNCRVYKA